MGTPRKDMPGSDPRSPAADSARADSVAALTLALEAAVTVKGRNRPRAAVRSIIKSIGELA
jgi:hypothetical protein